MDYLITDLVREKTGQLFNLLEESLDKLYHDVTAREVNLDTAACHLVRATAIISILRCRSRGVNE